MAETGVMETVEKMVAKAAPAEKPVEQQPAPEAPVTPTPEEKPTVPSPAPSSEKAGTGELTAFDQELIKEYQQEYHQVPEHARPAFLQVLKRNYRQNAQQMTELGTLRKAVKTLSDAG